jgi:hypothetical protein
MLIVWHHTWWKYYVAYEMGLKIKREKITKNTSLWLENGWKRGKLGRRWRRAEIAGAGKKGWRSAGKEGRSVEIGGKEIFERGGKKFGGKCRNGFRGSVFCVVPYLSFCNFF